MKLYGKIKNLKIDFLDEERFVEDLVKMEGKDIVFTLKENKDYRTNQQNKLWWKYMQIIGNELGYDKDEMHDICKLKFLKRERYEDGIRVEYLKSTAQLTKKEFKTFLYYLQYAKLPKVAVGANWHSVKQEKVASAQVI